MDDARALRGQKPAAAWHPRTDLPTQQAAWPASSEQPCKHEGRYKMTEPTCEGSSTELCREQFKTLLNLFYVPVAFANAILYSRSEITRELGRKLREY